MARHRKRVSWWPRIAAGAACLVTFGTALAVARLGNDAPLDSLPTALPTPSATRLPPISYTNLPTTTTEPPPPPVVTTTTPPPPAEITVIPAPTPAPKPKPAPPAVPAGSVALSDLLGGPSYGGVKPHVAIVGHFLERTFGYGIGGVAGRARVSDHPIGYAIDVLTGVTNRGDAVAACALKNQELWGVSYVIWKQRINDGSGWVLMENRGSVTENHFDHVHISFEHTAVKLPIILGC